MTVGSHEVENPGRLDDEMYPTSKVEETAVHNDDFTHKLIDSLSAINAEENYPNDELPNFNRFYEDEGHGSADGSGEASRHNDGEHHHANHNHHRPKSKNRDNAPNWDQISPEDLEYHADNQNYADEGNTNNMNENNNNGDKNGDNREHDGDNREHEDHREHDGDKPEENNNNEMNGDNNHSNYGDNLSDNDYIEKDHHGNSPSDGEQRMHAPTTSGVAHDLKEELNHYDLEEYKLPFTNEDIAVGKEEEEDGGGKRSGMKSFEKITDAMMEDTDIIKNEMKILRNEDDQIGEYKAVKSHE